MFAINFKSEVNLSGICCDRLDVIHLCATFLYLIKYIKLSAIYYFNICLFLFKVYKFFKFPRTLEPLLVIRKFTFNFYNMEFAIPFFINKIFNIFLQWNNSKILLKFGGKIVQTLFYFYFIFYFLPQNNY